MKKILEVENLEISFGTPLGRTYALRGVSFSLSPGEVLAIVGESGSGKSVSSKAIMGILPQNAVVLSGKIMYEGEDILELSEQRMCKIRGRKIAMIFQDPLSSLNPTMKVGRQITEAILKRGGISKSEARARAIELMGEVGISDAEKRFEQYPFQFSGGMRQRIVIAIALSGDPEILICDEPTTALDVTIQAQILDLIGELNKKRGLSVIFITHDLGVVARIADRIAVMYAGKIVEYGSTEEIFFDPRHPYTWALFSSVPTLDDKGRLDAIGGAVPSMHEPPIGDAFAPRNKYALEIDYELEPPMFEISKTHSAATWLLHPNAPKVQMPEKLKKRIEKMRYGE